MNHRKNYRKFNRTSSHRNMMFQNMCASLITNEKGHIMTTVFKGKELRRYLEPLITKAKKCTEDNKVATIRYLTKKLAGNKTAVFKLLDIAPKYKDVPGGYLKVIKCGFRHGDSAPMAYVLFVD